MARASLRALFPAVAEAARLAGGYFRGETELGAELKADASLVTAADRAVEVLLRAAIARHFPGARVIGEEGALDSSLIQPRGGGEFAALTFAVDPIDGTESFAVRSPGWCISIGVLDDALRPIGGIVHAPIWDASFLADLDPAAPALMNERPLPRIAPPRPMVPDERTPILVDSKAHRMLRWADFPGRCRGFGSTALHVCLVAEQRGAQLAQVWAPAIWDLVGAHAIAARVGVEIAYLNGAPLDYAPLMDGSRAGDHLLVGHPAALAAIGPCFQRLPGAERGE